MLGGATSLWITKALGGIVYRVVARTHTPSPIVRLITRLFSLLVALALVAPTARAQLDEEARRQALARRTLEAAQPGPEHERLASLAGEWELRVKYWTSPTSEPMVGTGTATNRPILDGRFLRSEAMMQLGERRSEALTILGYDRRASRYTALRLDTRGTHYLDAEGPYDEGSGAIVVYGEDIDRIGNRTERYTIITRFRGPDEYVQEILFRLPGGESFVAVEIRHTRKR